MSIAYVKPKVRGQRWPPNDSTNKKGHTEETLYAFTNDIDDEEVNTDQSLDLSELRSRGGSKAIPPVQQSKESQHVLIERPIETGDSLLSLSLKYGCQAADLKRVNNLISDQDFYALKTIKVPARRHGLLTELIEKENETRQKDTPKLRIFPSANGGVITIEGASGDETDYDVQGSEQSGLLNHTNFRTISIKSTLLSQSGEAVDFLHKMDSDIKNIVGSTKSRLDSLDEVKSRLTCRRFYPLEAKNADMGATCGLRIRSLLILMVVILGLVPLVYFVYFNYMRPPS